jgi:hypothetical protein
MTTTTEPAITTGPWIEVDGIAASDLPQEYITVLIRTNGHSLQTGYRVNQYTLSDDDYTHVFSHSIWCRTGDAKQVHPVWIAHVTNWTHSLTPRGEA